MGREEIRIYVTGLAFLDLPLDVQCHTGMLCGFYSCVTASVTSDQGKGMLLSKTIANYWSRQLTLCLLVKFSVKAMFGVVDRTQSSEKSTDIFEYLLMQAILLTFM